MNFIKSNVLAIFLVILVFINEYFHGFFEGKPFDGSITLDDAVYYLVNQIAAITLIPSVVFFFIINKNKLASKLILSGVIGYNCKEVYDEIMYIAKVNENVFSMEWGGMIFIATTFIFAAYGYSKWKH